MTRVYTHAKVTTGTVDDTVEVDLSDWNADHVGTGTWDAAELNANVVQAVVNDTNIQGVIAAQTLTFSWAGTLAAARLNANVVQVVTNDTNVTGAIASQTITLGWTGTLAAARLNANVVQAITQDTNVRGSITAQNLTFSWLGQLGLSRGGTNADLSATGGAANYLKQVSSGAAVTVGTIPASDIASGAALTKTDDTNVTLTLGGTPATALLKASSLTLGWTGTLAIGRGGTGASTQQAAFDALAPTATRAGDITYWNGTHYVNLAGNNSGTKVLQEDASGVPSWVAAVGTGTVTSIVGNGVTITATGTVPPPYGLVNHSLAVSASASALTIALKDNAGSDPSASSPVNGYFRSASATSSGNWTQLTVTGALSLVVSSGSTLGVTSSTAFRLWVVLFNDAGTARLGVINCSDATNIYPLSEDRLATSTAEGGAGAADSAGVFYTGTAVSAKAFLIVGYAEWSSSGLTAGTWTTTNLLYVQSFGPGVRKPGDVAQVTMASLNTAATFSSTSYVATSLSKTPTLVSAANMVRVLMSGAFTANVNGKRTYVQVFRNAAACPNGPEKTAFINTGAAAISDVNIIFYDRPNSTSPTYAVYGKIDSAGGGNFPDGTNTTNAQLILEEIVG